MANIRYQLKGDLNKSSKKEKPEVIDRNLDLASVINDNTGSSSPKIKSRNRKKFAKSCNFINSNQFESNIMKKIKTSVLDR